MAIEHITIENAHEAICSVDWASLEQILAVPTDGKKSASFIFKKANDTKGMLLAKHDIPPDFDYPTIHIGSLIVRDGDRNTGIGTKLLTELTNYADQYTENVSLVVNIENKAAIRLYERFGFHVVDVDNDSARFKMLRPTLAKPSDDLLLTL